ncbi:autotransporter outer membrane beta-barrel domain-containing protein [Burkholderia stabilis]|uniref:autotransporter family protein n=1 Tax=Burkholderia stabilis TaxID=95485 RepID=UPI000B231C99|nr:autotransporter outer membrane beta-barrel domain-containing protein [Burkholderia stabilis]
MKYTFLMFRARHCRQLAYSVAFAGAVAPWPSAAEVRTEGGRQADGVVLEVAPGDYSTSGDNRPVFSALNGGSLIATGKTRLFSFGHGSSGAAATGSGSHIELRNTEIRTRGIFATGIDARSGGSVSADQVTIDTDHDSAHGVFVEGAGSHADIVDSLIVTRGREAHGIALHHSPGGAVVNLADTQILTGGDFANGVYMGDDGLHARVERAAIRTTGDHASILFMPGASTATFDDSRLQTDGYAALGVDTREGHVELARTQVLTNGHSSHGLYASKEYTGTPSVNAIDTQVTTTGERAIGAIARLGGRIAMTGGGVATHGERSLGVVSTGTDSVAALTDLAVETHGKDADALHAGAGGTIDVLRTRAHATGDGAHAARVLGGTLNVDHGVLLSERYSAIEAGDAVIALRNGARAAGGNGTLLSVRAQSGAPVRLTLESGAHAQGDIVNRPADDGSATPAVTDVALSGASTWAGATHAVRALSLDTNSRWTVTADSTVGSVALNGSTIAFAEPNAGVPRTLAVQGDYAANNGKLVMHAVLGDDASPADRLVIDGGHASGNTGIIVKRTGGEGAQTTIGIPLVETRNGGTTDAAAFALDAASDGYRQGFGTLSAGGYDYMLARGGQGGQADDWYLVSAAQPEPPVPPVQPGPGDPDPSVKPETKPEIGPPPRAVAPEPDAYLANADAAATMAIHSLHQREDRTLRTEDAAAGPLDGAVWMRAEGQFTSQSGGTRSVSGTGRLIHAGADLLRFDDGRGGHFRIGAMGMYGSRTSWSTRPLWNAAEQRIANATARGSVAGYNAGLYGTWYGNRDSLSGPYVDAWVMFGAYANHVGGSLAGDSYRSRTVTGSLEAGHSFPLLSSGDTRFFVEPEAQLIVSDYRAAAHDAPGGRLDAQGSTDVLTRVGVRVHGVTAMAHGRALRPFIEANWWHGPGSRSLTLDRNAFSFSVPRDRAALRVGATGEMSRRFAVSASVGVEGNFSDYSVVSGQLAAKYRW